MSLAKQTKNVTKMYAPPILNSFWLACRSTLEWALDKTKEKKKTASKTPWSKSTETKKDNNNKQRKKQRRIYCIFYRQRRFSEDTKGLLLGAVIKSIISPSHHSFVCRDLVSPRVAHCLRKTKHVACKTNCKLCRFWSDLWTVVILLGCIKRLWSIRHK